MFSRFSAYASWRLSGDLRALPRERLSVCPMNSRRPLAVLSVLLIVAFGCAAGLSAVIAKATTGNPMMVLLLMIGLAMYFGRLFANWADR